MQKFFRAIETISKRAAGPDYPHRTRPITRRDGEPGISVKPFTQLQLETIRTIGKEKLESVFKKHFGELEFSIREDRLGMGKTFSIVTDPDTNQGPFIIVSTAPAEIEFNFKRSSCSMSKEDRRKYFLFLWELLGEQL